MLIVSNKLKKGLFVDLNVCSFILFPSRVDIAIDFLTQIESDFFRSDLNQHSKNVKRKLL